VELRHLRAFIAVVDAGGFARAALRLNVSQPALSRQIAALERELRVRLFDRIGRRVELTADGEDLVRRSRRVLDEANSLIDRASALRSGETGVLTIGATPQTIESVLAPFLIEHHRRRPSVDVHLVEDGGARLPARLERGELHLALIPAPDPRFQARLLFPVCVLAVLPVGHRLGRRAAVEVAELAEEPLLLLRHDFGSRRWFDAACEVAHIRPRILLESAAPHTLLALAQAKFGAALVPSNVPIPARGLQGIPLVQRGLPVAGWVALAWHPQRFLPRHAEQFAVELEARTRRNYPGRALIRRAPRVPRPTASPSSFQ
jgi:DNA-binding transcriptional LysR family regulator